MKLVVGLGNPGRKYEGTRHNVGFGVLHELASKYGVGKPKSAFSGEVIEADLSGEKVRLLCPLTYMNLSGGSALSARDFYKLNNEDILVVCDDFNLPVGKLRMRAEGSAGGQKGLQDIIRRLSTAQVPRLRVGVGSPLPNYDKADYVLSRFRADELPVMEIAIHDAADAVQVWAVQGIEVAMNKYNG